MNNALFEEAGNGGYGRLRTSFFRRDKKKQDYLSSLYSELGCYLENRWLHEFRCVDFDARVRELLVASYLGKNWIRVF